MTRRNRITGRHRTLITFLALAGTMLTSCTANKFLAEGESFYAGADIVFHPHGNVGKRKTLKSELEEMIAPKPNGTILGARPGVWIYYVTGTKTKGLGAWIRKKFGTEPVLLSDAKPELTTDILEGNLFNRGYFESHVQSSVERKRKKATVVYDIELYPPFRIRNIEIPRDSIFRDSAEIMRETFLREGQRYDLQRLADERSRLEMRLEDYGYYYFDDRHLLFEADTTVGGRKVDLKLTYAPDIPAKATRPYVMRNVDVVNDFSVWDAGLDSATVSGDTVRVDGYRYVSTEGAFRPRVLTDVINIRPGELYSRTMHNFTISHLMGLGTFKFVNIRYREAGDSLLDASIYLTPLLKKSLRLEVQGVSKSNNFVGPGVSATFTNRNFLGGAEQFQFKISGSYEVQINRQATEPLTAVELFTETSLSVPRMISPIRITYYSTKFIPHTNFKIRTTFQRRIGYFQLNSFNAAAGYSWRETTTKNHELYPIDLNYVRVTQKSQAFEDLLDENPYLSNSFQDQFIPGMRYSFQLNTQLQDPGAVAYDSRAQRRSHFFFHGNLNLSGNLANWIAGGQSDSEGTQGSIFGQPFSQFVLGDVDFRYYLQLDRRNRLVFRLAAGSGYPYGNSTQLPYIKQFSTGGSNSIRAFPARTVGPGTFHATADPEDIQFIDQRGDIKLEGNVEYRFDIVRFLKGAVFVDAGNIWLLTDDEQRPGGKFAWDSFLHQLAVGTGLGLRLDFQFFILRFDVGIPIRKPWLDEGEQWVVRDITFSSSEWRKSNLVFNIAVGYPF
ncbi:MAG TPA: BamA/TamA family outer membrane protein [Cyclobacteriaceae bacterium]|nr:BamA/TamA family outer membrane protein [Cyclobacteriaceae bacterium]